MSNKSRSANVDYWYGKVWLPLANLVCLTTQVVFISDHGALLNEKNQWCKGPERLRRQVTHAPLIIRTPDTQYAGKHVAGFAHAPDVYPTLLAQLNLKSPDRVTGENLWQYVTGAATNKRKHAISAYGYVTSVRT